MTRDTLHLQAWDLSTLESEQDSFLLAKTSGSSDSNSATQVQPKNNEVARQTGGNMERREEK